MKNVSVRPAAPVKLSAVSSSIPPAKESVINFPVRVDVSAILSHANDVNVIPQKFDHWGDYIKSPQGVDYKYYAERDNFVLGISGAYVSGNADHDRLLRDWWKGVGSVEPVPGVSISAPLRYKIGASSRLRVADMPVQCGDGGEWPRKGMVKANIAIGMTSNYSMSASVTGVAVNAIDSCKVTVADIDVAQEAKNTLAGAVKAGLDNAVAPLNGVTVKPQIEDAWSALGKPIQLGPDTWLLFNVTSVGHSGFSGNGPVMEDTIHFMANPVIVFGAEPSPMLAGIPPLNAQVTSPTVYIAADSQLSYDELSKALTSRLIGKRVHNGGETIEITRAAIFGNGGNQLVVRIDFKGGVSGHAYFVGKPEINLLTQTVYIGRLQYTPETEEVLQKDADWLYSSTFREFIAGETVFGITSATDRLRKVLATSLNRPLTPALSMQGTVSSVQGTGAFADVDALYIRAVSDGTLSLTARNKP